MPIKRIFLIDSFVNKNIYFNKVFIILVIFLSNITTIASTYSSGINAPYPVALQLKNNNLFIANSEGMYFCDQNLVVDKSHEYQNKMISNFQEIINKILIAQFDEGNIICLVEDVFYFFDEFGNFIIMGEFPNAITQSFYLNLLAYKKDINDNYHFIITFMDSSNKILNLYHYQVNNNAYNIVSNFTYIPFYFDYPTIQINSKFYTCQIMDSDEKGYVLTCCFQTFDGNLIVIQSFDIENNLAEIEEYYAKTPITSLNIITSVISEDKKNILVFFSPDNFYAYSFTYNYDLNEISNYKIPVEKCTEKYSKFKLNYFKEKQEYMFICEYDNKFTVIKLDKDFKLLNPDEITTFNFEIPDHYIFNSLSLIYDTNEGKYAMISDPQNSTIQSCFTTKFYITTNFTQNFPSQNTRPADFVEDFQYQELTLKETNKYYVNVENYKMLALSNKSRTVLIDFMDPNNLFIRTKYNTTIDPSLYSFLIQIEGTKGRLTAEINGEEKDVGAISYIPNITHLNYYPIFASESYSYSFTFFLYLKNKTLASRAGQVSITVCQENCTCDINTMYCSGCIENYIFYKVRSYCTLVEDFRGLFYDQNNDIYLDCYVKCKTCSKIGYSEQDMGCLSCYEENGYYMEDDKCIEIICENLFYYDKDTGIKTCVEGDSCPEEYPILNSDTKQCEQEKTEDPTEQPSFSEDTQASSTQGETTEAGNESTNVESSSPTDEALSLVEAPTTEVTESEETSESSTQEKIEYTEPHTDSKTSEINQDDDDDKVYQKIMNKINELIGEENIDQINKTYSLLSDSIKSGDISSFSKDITISGANITYQLTTSDKQKNSDQNTNVSVIDLGECEKIIKRNISYEDDPTPLLILKIDVKKSETKTTAVEYEVYNPYTRDKIDLSICSNISIAIYAPVSLNNKETSLYDDLSNQGYDLFDANNSFYIDPCAPYTSSNGTDVSLHDRKDYYYNQDIVLCEDSCKYVSVNTKTDKVLCNCTVKNGVNVDSDQEFSPQKLIEQFYKFDSYSNFEVLYCYKLVFSAESLKKNICFYIMTVLFALFLTSMIINLITAMKKIDEIIFKIFQDRFMYYFLQKIIVEGRKKRNAKGNINISKEGGALSKLGWLQRLKLARNKKQNVPSNGGESPSVSHYQNLYNINEKEMKNIKIAKDKKRKIHNKVIDTNMIHSNIQQENNNEKLELKSKKTSKKNLNFEHNEIKEENDKKDIKDEHHNKGQNIENNNEHGHKPHDNEKVNKKTSNININIINNIINKNNYPPKRKNITLNETNFEESQEKVKRRKAKMNKEKSNNNNEIGDSTISNSNSIINLKRTNINKQKAKKTLFSVGDSIIGEKGKKKRKKKINIEKKVDQNQNQKENDNKKKNIKYIDEELNRMDFEDAIENDKRNYWQYYWSLLKKKHMVILTFVSNDDYNVLTLKFSLFILSIALFFSINTLFYKDSTMHQIFTESGKYNLLYQIPQVIYSTLISFLMTFILKKLSLSQNELMVVKQELDQAKSKALADKCKKCMTIKLYSFFGVGLSLLIFFCYYISAFAAVYTNTQIHLIKDTLLSFGVSMSYPFIINLFPGLFRLPALKNGTKEKECLYKTGQILALL